MEPNRLAAAVMLRIRNALQRLVHHRSVGHSSNFGRILSKEQQEYTSNYVSACTSEPPQVAHVSFWLQQTPLAPSTSSH
jgi:hypothetical protein